MKTFIRLMLFSICLTLTAACDKSPEFEFRMDLTGAVTEAVTNISADMIIHVDNVADTVDFLACDRILPLSAPSAARANRYLDDLVNRKILENLQNGAIYAIEANGYITEKTTGLTFKIKKRWSNRLDDPINL